MNTYHCTITLHCWDPVDCTSYTEQVNHTVEASCLEEAIHDCKEQYDNILEVDAILVDVDNTVTHIQYR